MNTQEEPVEIKSYLDWALKGRSAWWLYLIGLVIFQLILTVGSTFFVILLVILVPTLASGSVVGSVAMTTLGFLPAFLAIPFFTWLLHKRPWWSVALPQLKLDGWKLGIGFLFGFLINLVVYIAGGLFAGSQISFVAPDLSTYLPLLIVGCDHDLHPGYRRRTALSRLHHAIHAPVDRQSSADCRNFRTGVCRHPHSAMLFKMEWPGYGILIYLFDGLVYGWLAWRSRSLWMPIGFHLANNFALVVLINEKASTDILQGSPLIVVDKLPSFNFMLVVFWRGVSTGCCHHQLADHSPGEKRSNPISEPLNRSKRDLAQTNNKEKQPMPKNSKPENADQASLQQPPHVDRSVLPIPPAPFKGTIGLRANESTPSFPHAVTAPEGAPNVVLILMDDVGFGAASPFGGPINTPTFQKLAEAGLRYNQFHTTALCSPTRAALITGRNHHSAHTGVVTEMATGYPGYDSVLGHDMVTIGEMLKLNGYNTAWFGKDHNVSDWESSQAGPFDRWPTGLGFEKFYGFIGGLANNWRPALYDGTTPIEPYMGKPDYNLDFDLADQAISWMKMQKTMAPDKPFFMYYATAAGHAPQQARPEWIAKYQGPVRPGLGQDARGDLRAPEADGRHPGRCQADTPAEGDAGLGFGQPA